MKKDLFFQKFKVLFTLLGFFNANSFAGVLSAEKDDPPVVVVPPNK